MAEINLSLVVFTLLIGFCTGTFLCYGLWQFNGLPSEKGSQKSTRLTMLLLLLCWGVAMLASASHLGKPFRFLNAFRNPGSMIAQEGLWSIALGVTLLIAVVMAFKGQNIPKTLYAVGAFLSCGLLLVCSLVYVRAAGFPAWSSGVTIVYYFGSALLLGVAFVYFLSAQQGEKTAGSRMASLALAAVLMQIIVSVAFVVHLKFDAMYVILPSTVGMDVVRWGIGLFIPAAIAYLAWRDKMKIRSAAWSFLACVVIGEIFSRLIFFMQGVHL